MFLFSVLATKIFGFCLLVFGNEGVSFGVYDIKKSLTPLGWAIVITLPIALITGTIYLIAKIFKKPKLK